MRRTSRTSPRRSRGAAEPRMLACAEARSRPGAAARRSPALEAHPQASQARGPDSSRTIEDFVEVLFASEVERSDDDGWGATRAAGRGRSGSGLLRREAAAPGDEQELRAVQPDPAAPKRIATAASSGTRRWPQDDLDAVQRDGREVARRGPRVLARHPEVVLRPRLDEARRFGSTTTSPRSPSTMTIAPTRTLRATSPSR
jgi:hypothetical protein